MRSDDDSFDEPLSSRRALERADHGKAERNDDRQKKGLQKLKLDVLKQKLDTKGKAKDSSLDDLARQVQDMTTKTRVQEAKQAVEEAGTKPSGEKLIRKEQQEEAAKQQTPYERTPTNLG